MTDDNEQSSGFTKAHLALSVVGAYGRYGRRETRRCDGHAADVTTLTTLSDKPPSRLARKPEKRDLITDYTGRNHSPSGRLRRLGRALPVAYEPWLWAFVFCANTAPENAVLVTRALRLSITEKTCDSWYVQGWESVSGILAISGNFGITVSYRVNDMGPSPKVRNGDHTQTEPYNAISGECVEWEGNCAQSSFLFCFAIRASFPGDETPSVMDVHPKSYPIREWKGVHYESKHGRCFITQRPLYILIFCQTAFIRVYPGLNLTASLFVYHFKYTTASLSVLFWCNYSIFDANVFQRNHSSLEFILKTKSTLRTRLVKQQVPVATSAVI